DTSAVDEAAFGEWAAAVSAEFLEGEGASATVGDGAGEGAHLGAERSAFGQLIGGGEIDESVAARVNRAVGKSSFAAMAADADAVVVNHLTAEVAGIAEHHDADDRQEAGEDIGGRLEEPGARAAEQHVDDVQRDD